MEKRQILKMTEEKLSKLKKQYREACNNMSNGKQCTKGGAAVTRSRLKRDICIMTFIEELLKYPEDSKIYGEDAITGVEKLIM